MQNNTTEELIIWVAFWTHVSESIFFSSLNSVLIDFHDAAVCKIKLKYEQKSATIEKQLTWL